VQVMWMFNPYQTSLNKRHSIVSASFGFAFGELFSRSNSINLRCKTLQKNNRKIILWWMLTFFFDECHLSQSRDESCECIAEQTNIFGSKTNRKGSTSVKFRLLKLKFKFCLKFLKILRGWIITNWSISKILRQKLFSSCE